jgi:hypothetical protein
VLVAVSASTTFGVFFFVRLKQAAAEIYCKAIGLIYVISDIEPLSDSEIHDLIESGAVRLTERYSRIYADKYTKKA